MINYKRLLAAGLVSTMIFTGCGSSDTVNDTLNNNVESEQTSAIVDTTEVSEATETPERHGYNILWSDEFDGDTLDESKWTRELRDPGWTNNELQEYTDSEDNVFVKDGCLVLKAIKTTDENGNDYYTSGKVNSQNKQDFTYGKVVVGAKVPEGQGLWPAIWMMPQDESYYGQWPKCGEIDIMEVLGNDTGKAYCTVHYGAPHAEQQGTVEQIPGAFSSSFHEYSVEWEPGEMRWYIDGSLVLKVNDWFTAEEGEDDKPYPAPFDQPFFVQMNLAVGGSWPGNPDETTDFDNAEFLIDYVRVYQKDSYDTNVEKPQVIYREALEDGNYIYNGDFSEAEDLNDDTNWKFILLNDGSGNASIENNEIVIATDNCGTEEYSVQLVQPELPVIKGHTYRVTFEAKADADRDMIFAVTAPTAGWIRYYQDTKIDLTTDYQEFSFEFTSDEKDDNNGRIEYNMGNHGFTDTIHIRNVRYEDITE